MANTEVGTAYVAIIPSAKGFARNLQKEIAKEFAGSNLDKAIGDALGERKPIKLPVQADIDTAKLPDTVPVRAGREPKLPVELDPLIGEFQSQVRRQVAALSREVNANIPVSAETAGLRSELAAQIASVERQLKVEVPTEPAGRREYEARLHALVAEVSRKVKASVQVEPDVDRNRFRTALMSGVSSALGAVSSAASTMVGAISAATSSLTGLVTSLLAVVGAAGLIVPGVYLVGGAIGSLPAIIAGAVAAFGALSLGMMGIADHFKEVSGGGGGAGQNLAAQARQVAQATRGVESAQRSLARAQREVVLAQQAVTRARAEEVERLQDLNRSAARARLDEQRAIEGVKEAKEALDDARATGRVDDIRQASLDYQDAVLSLDEAKDAVGDLKVEQAKAAKVGVEGSDQVQDALRRQQDAVEGVTAANEQLLSAQEALQAANEKPAAGGGGGAAQELLKLAPAAQRFVDAVKGLKPAFEQLRLNVQQKLFAGLDVTVKRLATAWFPQLNKTLGDYASTFNGLAKRAADSLSQKSFIDNMAAGAESARKALKRVGDAVSGPLVDAFGRLSRAAGPFVEKLGDEVADLVEDFSAWITQADKSGELDNFFQRASEILGDVFDMGRDIASIFGSVMEILFNDGDQTVTNSPWESLKLTLDELAAWFKDPENQQKMRDFLDEVKKFLTEDLPAAIAKAQEIVDTVDGWIDKVEDWKNTLTGAWDAIKTAAQEKLDEVVAFFAALPGRVQTALSELPGKVREKIVEMAGQAGYALGQAIGSWINLVAGMPGRAANALRNLPGQLAAIWQRAKPVVEAAIRTLVGSAITLVKELPGKAVDALKNTGTTLRDAGRALIDGLIKGIKEKVPELSGFLDWVSGMIPSWKGPYDRDKVLLLPAGRAIMSGLMTGIEAEVPALRSQLGDVTDLISGTAADLAAGSAGDWGPGPGAVPAPAPVTLGFGGEAPDSFLRWMRENVRVYYGGSPQAALGS